MTTTNDPRTPFTVIAEWQIFCEYDNGDPMDPAALVEEYFDRAITNNQINSFEVLDVQPSSWRGLYYIIFKADLMMHMEISTKKLKRKTKRRLDRIVGDTDVNVRWITRR